MEGRPRLPASRREGASAGAMTSIGTRSRTLADDDEFHTFAAAFLPTLLKGAYLLLRDIDLAEDAVQGTLLRVFRHWPEARHAPEAYSRVTLVSVCRDHWRRLRRRPGEVPSTNLEPSPRERGVTFDDTWAERQELEDALASLGSPQREVMILRFFLELTVSETATVLGIPEGTVKSSTHRGLQQMRDLLAAAEEVSNSD